MGYPDVLQQLIKALSTLPGIGAKSAERIAVHILKRPEAEVREIAHLMADAKRRIFFCEECRNLSTEKLCVICTDPSRNKKSMCIVGDPKDVALIEKTGSYHGLYHVLFGAISPIEGIGPKELRIDELLKRISALDVAEVVLATNPDTEGDATALYLSEKLKSSGIKVTRIARGVPIGSHLEYVDQATLQQAFDGRTAMN